MSTMHHITDENFETKVLSSEKLFVVDFFSEWCQPCKMMEPVFEKLSEEFKGEVSFGKLDVSANNDVPSKYGVMSIPTFIIFKNGEAVKRLMGVTPGEKFKSHIKEIL